ncbi:hypothetical protein GCM10011502_16350 [Oceanisphaera marina]|uniref:Phage shock protein B n=1 Tax=Oceanisphaera marina TaxID=2017550 RepID=A0ABQ1IIS8_9GAMM|nr:hypothetical protein [Oceanisphaera marina]GGB43740.1 hypothetical protein GCM10011502_16350 [Oceanisphaera marina]
MMWILLFGLAIGAVLLVVHQGRNQTDISLRLQRLEADNQQLRQRVQVLEELVLEKEKQRPFDELK